MFNPTEYARAWRAKNKEHVNLYNRNRWQLKKRYWRRNKQAAGAQNRCAFCEKLLDKELKAKKYCKSCKSAPGPKLYLKRVYALRARQRAKGLPQSEIIHHEKQRKNKE